MALIKASHSAPLLRDAVVLDLGDLARQADVLKAAAQAQATRLIETAKREAARITAGAHEIGLEQGHALGLQRGLEEGRRLGREEALKQVAGELKALQESWSKLADELESQRQALERDARVAVLELALELGRKVTHRQVEVDPTVAADQLREVLAHVLRPVDVTVRICPQDRPLLEQALPRLMSQFPRLQHLRLVDDAAVGRGGCKAEYGQGRIDASVHTQLQRIVETLLPAEHTKPQETQATP